MGILDKMKNLFTEEVDEEVVEPKRIERKVEHKHPKPEIKEIKAEEKHVEIAPARKETALLFETDIEEEEPLEIKEEPPVVEKPIKPFYFSDEDFADLPKREEKPTPVRKDLYNFKKEEPKVQEPITFKPSPIISPVYGVLDKNYSKEDIKPKVAAVNPYKSDKITVDDVRNKAFGTLEDEVESKLIEPEVVKEEKIENTGINIFEELENTNTGITRELERQKQQIEEINEIIKTTVKPETEQTASRKIDNILEELNEIEDLLPEEEFKEIDTKDDVKESDLFNLIDSMYETRDE